MILAIYRGTIAPLKTQLDKLEAAGQCTLCARDLHPHERGAACERTKYRARIRQWEGGRKYYFLSEE